MIDEIFLGAKVFSYDDQINFAQLSGDNNPIHLETLYARKTISGECIVHGINSFLWALEFILKNSKSIYLYYKINFKNKIPLNQKIKFILEENKNLITIRNRFNKILVHISYEDTLNNISIKKDIYSNRNKTLERPLIFDENTIKLGKPIKSIYGGDDCSINKIYPYLSKRLGKNLVYEISTLSNIIGMQIPGKNSLFTNFQINFKKQNNLYPYFRVENYKKNLGLIKLRYIGNNFDAKMQAFLLKKSKSSIIDAKFKEKLLNKNTHNGRKALIIGGSRGIGSFVAKVISLLGAKVTISYLACEEDALKVCNDINKNVEEPSADIVKFNVLEDNYNDVFKISYDYLFYFATPKIFDNESKMFSEELYTNFKDFYAIAFKKLASDFISKGGGKIYYPSSIAVLNNVKGMEEYTKAKKDGESVCNELRKNLPVKIIIDRIDRVDTDQTLSIIPSKSLNPFDLAIEIAEKMK